MLNDKILEWIFARREMQKLTFEEQSTFIHDLDELLEEEKDNAAVCES